MIRYLEPQKRRALVKAFFESQFKSCPLVWMFHSRQSNQKLTESTKECCDWYIKTIIHDDDNNNNNNDIIIIIIIIIIIMTIIIIIIMIIMMMIIIENEVDWGIYNQKCILKL